MGFMSVDTAGQMVTKKSSVQPIPVSHGADTHCISDSIQPR